MIPPGGAIQDTERVGKENEAERRETPRSPGGGGPQHESKLQRLKRSLSFKAKSLRSKSADNFFQRASSDVRMQVDLLPEVSSGGLGPAPLPVPGCSPGRLPRPPDGAAHSFLEHVFKKPTFCDICNHMIVGTTAKHGLRCKACKMSIHHKCVDGVGQQRCMGKLPKGFRRYYSSPLLIQEQFGCIKEVMPIACGSKVDPVYEALRFGTSLAQKTKRTSVGSGSESPRRNSTSDLAEVPEEGGSHSSQAELSRKHSDNVFVPLENGTEHLHAGEGSRDELPTWAHERTGRTLQRGLVDGYERGQERACPRLPWPLGARRRDTVPLLPDLPPVQVPGAALGDAGADGGLAWRCRLPRRGQEPL